MSTMKCLPGYEPKSWCAAPEVQHCRADPRLQSQRGARNADNPCSDTHRLCEAVP